MNTLDEIANRADEMPILKSAKVWKGKRVYIELYARNHTYRGDRSHQLYYCADRGMISHAGSGIMTDDYLAAIAQFLGDFGAEGQA